jgi:hypothetical protein
MRLLLRGYTTLLLPKPWQEVHFIAYLNDGVDMLYCHISNRLRIESKLENQDLMLAFPVGEDIYFLEHDTLVELAGVHSNFLNTPSWKTGKYETARPNRQLLDAIQEYKL